MTHLEDGAIILAHIRQDNYLWLGCHWYSHFSLYFQPSSTCLATGIVLPVGKYNHNSSRTGPSDGSTSLAWASCVSAGLWADPALASSFTSAVAALTWMRPSSANLRVKCAISESYSSHSGICRARESFGSFYTRSSAARELPVPFQVQARTVSGFWQRSIVLARRSLSLLPERQ
jgi:hypothetical protein